MTAAPRTCEVTAGPLTGASCQCAHPDRTASPTSPPADTAASSNGTASTARLGLTASRTSAWPSEPGPATHMTHAPGLRGIDSFVWVALPEPLTAPPRRLGLVAKVSGPHQE